MEQSRERNSALPLHLGVIAIKKGAFWSPSTTVANFTFLLYYKVWPSSRLTEIRWSVCISKSQRSLCLSFSRLGCAHGFVSSNLNFLHNSQWITLPTQLCLVLNSFYANLLHSLIMWLMISFLITTWPTFAILLRIICSCFDMIGLYSVILCCYQEIFCFSLKVSLSLQRPCFLMWDIAY